MTKSGPARLALAGDQSFPAGAGFHVTEGTLEFITPPSDGMPLSGGGTGANLGLLVEDGARLSWQTMQP